MFDGINAFLGWLVQVLYPILDGRVKNVTLAYSVEHEDEVRVC